MIYEDSSILWSIGFILAPLKRSNCCGLPDSWLANVYLDPIPILGRRLFCPTLSRCVPGPTPSRPVFDLSPSRHTTLSDLSSKADWLGSSSKDRHQLTIAVNPIWVQPPDLENLAGAITWSWESQPNNHTRFGQPILQEWLYNRLLYKYSNSEDPDK